MKGGRVVLPLLLVLFLALVSWISAEQENQLQQFAEFRHKYHKVYDTVKEFELRYEIFKDNLIEYKELQKKNPRATFGVNKFSDLSKEEFASQYLMKNIDPSSYKRPPAKNFSIEAPAHRVTCNPDPTNFDWYAGCTGTCTRIYNQGACGSCWAFSATETIESYNALAGNPLVSLSMEQVVDCDTGGADGGCSGGFPTGAFQYVMEAGGIESYATYPYFAESGQSGQCQFSASSTIVSVTNYFSINGELDLYLQSSSTSGGPISVCVDASTWSGYSGGVLTTCGDTMDHCVQLTGYANYGEQGAYWIVRNSWGEWGMNGFIWLEIGQNLCGVANYATIVSATTISS